MEWAVSWRADPVARALADRHYNRQKVGAPQFVPPGACVVLRTRAGDAFWVTAIPKAEYVLHEWAGAWMCTAYRREGGAPLASEAIRDAVAATVHLRGSPPPMGFVTFFDPAKVPGFVRRTPDGPVMEWGYSYFRAGWRYAGWTKSGLFARQLLPEDFPPPRPPLPLQEEAVAPAPASSSRLVLGPQLELVF